MNVIQSILYGLVSGLCRFVPISASGHQMILAKLFGSTSHAPLRHILIHIAILAAIIVSCGTYLEKLRRAIKLRTRRSVQSRSIAQKQIGYDIRLYQSATIPMIILIVLFYLIGWSGGSYMSAAILFALNGIILYLPDYLPQSNKDSRNMSVLDSFLLALSGALSMVTGLSGIGIGASCAIARGADRGKAYSWMILLTIPVLVLFIAFDIFGIFRYGFGVHSLIDFIGCILSALSAFFSALLGIYLMRFAVIRSGFGAFAFYNWGAAILSFLLFLIA